MKPDVFQLIDLDRTLFDTARFASALTHEVSHTEPEVGRQLQQQVQASYEKEETFFLLRYLREERGDDWFESVVQRIVSRLGAQAFKMAGFDERLELADTLSSAQPAWGILTYGDEIDQRMKLAIVGLQEAPVYISDVPDKDRIIATWQQPDGSFQLPAELGGEEVSHVTLEDDKLRAFTHLPENVTGVWLTDDAAAQDRLAALSIETQQAVKIARNLAESSQYLRSVFAEGELLRDAS